MMRREATTFFAFSFSPSARSEVLSFSFLITRTLHAGVGSLIYTWPRFQNRFIPLPAAFYLRLLPRILPARRQIYRAMYLAKPWPSSGIWSGDWCRQERLDW
jgi:hypothetical protein